MRFYLSSPFSNSTLYVKIEQSGCPAIFMKGFILMEFLIVCPLVFVAGFIDAVAGGGGLISLPAYLIAGVPVHAAIGTNKLSSGMGTALATWRYWKSGFIPWKEALICAVVALAASALGAKLTLMIDEGFLRIVLLFILPATAIYLLFHKSFGEAKEPYSWKKTLAYSMLAAFCIGAYDGFYGPGTGTFLILMLTGLAHMPLDRANGVAKVINLCSNVACLVVMLFNGKVLILLGFVAGLFSLLGNYLGTRTFQNKGAKIAKPMILLVISIFFVKTIIELI